MSDKLRKALENAISVIECHATAGTTQRTTDSSTETPSSTP